jgi:hypothetical protein
MLLLGLGILLFSGYAITLRGRHLEPRRAIHFLGERQLLPGKPAAFRLIAWDMKWEKGLPVSRVDLELAREPGLKASLARKSPNRAIVHMNVVIPDWLPGRATLRAKIETELGPLALETEVWLDPRSTARLRLVPPARELKHKPVLFREGAGQVREPVPADDTRAPSTFAMFPQGGRLTSTFATRLLIRVADSQGRAVPGELQVDDQKPQEVDQDGLAEVVITEGIVPRRLHLTFGGETGRLTGEVSLIGNPSQLDLAVDRILVQAGTDLGLHVRSLSPAQTVYLEGWWPGGWIHSAELETVDSRGSGRLKIPPGIAGPLLVRISGDAFGRGKARRELAVMSGGNTVPTFEQGFAHLRGLEADPGFWETLSGLAPGERSLGALLSRIKTRTDEGPLPELVNGSQAEQAVVARRKSDLQQFGLGLSGLVSALAWLVVAWLLLSQAWRMRSQKISSRRSWTTALLALGVVTLALAGGWIWLYWGS